VILTHWQAWAMPSAWIPVDHEFEDDWRKIAQYGMNDGIHMLHNVSCPSFLHIDRTHQFDRHVDVFDKHHNEAPIT
jgi:hypothetical protein